MTNISDTTIEIVKATAPLVKDNVEKITSIFYPKMLGRHPELYKYFNETNQRTGRQTSAFGDVLTGKTSSSDKCLASAQSKTLADAVVAYALNIDKLENLSTAVMRICHKHCALGITPADYVLVHDNLMESIGEVLGDAVTEPVAAAWSEAVMFLAHIFIGIEKDLYAKAAAEQWPPVAGGTGPKEFEIIQIIDQTPDVKSFRLVAVDGKRPGPYLPGQYISVFEKPNPNKKYFAPRHYTLTSQPSDPYYQVTIKALKAANGFDNMFNKLTAANGLDGIPDGEMSTYMHTKKQGDIVKLGPVFGPNILAQGDDASRTVACFISVGIGITPTWSMLPTAMATKKTVCVFHADECAKNVPFQKEIINLLFSKNDNRSAADNDHILSFSYSRPVDAAATVDDNDDKLAQTYYSEGYLTADKICTLMLAKKVDYKQGTDYYVCAGASTADIVKGLWKHGVNKNHVHTEFFGPFASVADDDE